MGQTADLISITYYTDPLCCWSWAFEPEWKKLLENFNDVITWRYCMSGLLPGWSNYHDALNSISKPSQMGPMWMHAAELTGIDIKHGIWASDPPASSYPACIAVKSARLQSAAAGERYLFLLREACMTEGKNIAKKSVLLEIANGLSKYADINFDLTYFKDHLFDDDAVDAFRKDIQEVKYLGINRFPSLLIKNNSGDAKLITGYTRYELLEETLYKFLKRDKYKNKTI